MVFLNLCGLRNSPPDHWQSLWEQRFPGLFRRVPQQDWAAPDNTAWTAALDKSLQSIPQKEDIVLIGHSVGCATIVNWVRDYGNCTIRAALLVAPSDVERSDSPTYITGFSPLQLAPLPFPSLVVASSDDHVVRPERARFFADTWGSGFQLIEAAGHLEASAGYGRWPEGLQLLSQISGTDLA
ncbi:MAG: alpha/beta hydrolase [Bacteroidota bacterium]